MQRLALTGVGGRIWSGLPMWRRGVMIISIPVACLIISLSSWIVARQLAIASTNQIDWSEERLKAVNQLRAESLEAESALRGYGITQASSLLRLHSISVETVPEYLERLIRLTEHRSPQRERVYQLRALINELFQEFDQRLAIQATNDASNLQRRKDLLIQRQQTLDQLNLVLDEFIATEQQLLQEREENLRRQRHTTTLIIWFSCVLGLMGAIAALYLFQQLYRELRSQGLLLQRSETQMQAVVENVVDGILTLSSTGKIQTVNLAVVKMFGYYPEELAGKPFHLLFREPLKLHNHQVELVTDDSSERIPFRQSFRATGARKVGADFPVEIAISNMQIEDQRIAIVRDITEQQRAEMETQKRAEELSRMSTSLAKTNAILLERNRELDQFAYVASHDLKAPLRAIANLSEWIEEDLSGNMPENVQHQMQLLRRRVQRMEGLINGLLQYARVGRMETIIETVDVNDLLQEIIDSMAPIFEGVITIQNKMPTLQTKRLLLRQVLANLISNAIKHHHHSNGHIQINVREKNSKFYEFSISDDGPGIEADYHEKIFTIFQVLETRDHKENTGIGLSIVKKIVDGEGGSITLESEVGEGTTFYFTWPRSPIS